MSFLNSSLKKSNSLLSGLEFSIGVFTLSSLKLNSDLSLSRLQTCPSCGFSHCSEWQLHSNCTDQSHRVTLEFFLSLTSITNSSANYICFSFKVYQKIYFIITLQVWWSTLLLYLCSIIYMTF